MNIFSSLNKDRDCFGEDSNVYGSHSTLSVSSPHWSNETLLLHLKRIWGQSQLWLQLAWRQHTDGFFQLAPSHKDNTTCTGTDQGTDCYGWPQGINPPATSLLETAILGRQIGLPRGQNPTWGLWLYLVVTRWCYLHTSFWRMQSHGQKQWELRPYFIKSYPESYA